MKNLSTRRLSLLFATVFAIVISACTSAVVAQTVYQSQGFDIRLNGTSDIHDWEMKAVKGTSEASFILDAQGKITSLTKLNFTLPAKNLKSEHTVMDKNTYKALKTDNNPNIVFIGTSSTITQTDGNNYRLTCKGNLSIAGTTKPTELIATVKFNPAEKSLTVVGVKKFKMTDYNVAPPKALMGTIKTGNDISISYNLKFVK